MVYRPTARVLATLEMLQVHGQLTGAELARRLEVDERTVRKYVETLRDLGVPIEARRGRAGAYRLRAGSKLPPLIFSDAEAIALVLGLIIAQRSGLADEIHLPAVLAKIERVLPETTREQVDAVASGIDFEPTPAKPVPSLQVVTILATAARAGDRVRMTYASTPGESIVREFNCYGVAAFDGAWYATGYCHLRQEERIFRLDRIEAVTRLESSFTPPSVFSPLDAIRSSLARVPRQWTVSVRILAPLHDARASIALSSGHFAACDDGSTRILVEVDDLRWMARVLAGSGLRFVIESPPELGEAVLAYAEELVAQVEGSQSYLEPREEKVQSPHSPRAGNGVK